MPSHTQMPPSEVREAFSRLRLARSGKLAFTPLSGGVSSDIWKVETGDATFCVKRARPKLAVSADWRVPVERNHNEAEFLRVVGAEFPGLAPDLVAEDRDASLIVMPYYDPDDWRVWKSDLLEGRIDRQRAGALGAVLADMAIRTCDRPELADRFANHKLFHALRLEPYLEASARRHPELAKRLMWLVEDTGRRRVALVHGDVSPKNILLDGAGGLKLLDAECATYGDPAFDAAFFVNHLLLKSVHLPHRAQALCEAFSVFAGSYRQGLGETADAVLRRVAHLVPGLFLARVDGKSPVEYLTEPGEIDRVRAISRRFLAEPIDDPEAIADWVLKEVRR